jgi:hypothetical protein
MEEGEKKRIKVLEIRFVRYIGDKGIKNIWKRD